jgi:hypothetical protein
VRDLRSLTIFYVDVATLRAQEAYWQTLDRLVIWLNYEQRFLSRILAWGKPTLPAKPTLRL